MAAGFADISVVKMGRGKRFGFNSKPYAGMFGNQVRTTLSRFQKKGAFRRNTAELAKTYLFKRVAGDKKQSVNSIGVIFFMFRESWIGNICIIDLTVFDSNGPLPAPPFLNSDVDQFLCVGKMNNAATGEQVKGILKE